jgi:NAD(P)-dependent dehydrogenase (short-subunit alcohol dehydrogenase family)
MPAMTANAINPQKHEEKKEFRIQEVCDVGADARLHSPGKHATGVFPEPATSKAMVPPIVVPTRAAAPAIVPAIAPRTIAFSGSVCFSKYTHKPPAISPRTAAASGLHTQHKVFITEAMIITISVIKAMITLDLAIIPPVDSLGGLYQGRANRMAGSESKKIAPDESREVRQKLAIFKNRSIVPRPPRGFFLRTPWVYNFIMADLPLSGRTAIVTGAAVRLGRAIALGLAAHGADIALHYHSSEAEALRTAEEIRHLGRRCLPISADLQNPASPAKILEAAGAFFGKADILINSAAIFEPGTLAQTSPELWEKTIAVNLRAPFFLCKAFAAQTDAGDIINLADATADRSGPNYLAYSVAKNALIALTRTLARSLAPGIRVNAIAPGAILPPPGRGEDYLDRIAAHIPLGKHGTPEDIVGGVVYLLTAPYVTGEVLHISGGAD